ncbi:MAG: AraC family transcriptional regulator [Aquabacterium sp.]|nr:MAG: AraC family transcriptional regulator [Aquabacterium sp.]
MNTRTEARPLPVHARAHAAPPPALDALGCLSNHLLCDQELEVEGVRIYRKTASGQELGAVETPPTGRGVLLGISLAGGHRRRIVHEHHAAAHDFERGSIYVRHFADRYRAEMKSAFDFLLIELPHAALGRVKDDGSGARSFLPACVTAERDDVMHHLALALLPALERPQEASRLFVDQMSVAIATYLLDKHGGAAEAGPSRKARLLSRTQEARAKEMLRSRMNGDISVSDVAQACNLSRSYFIHAFRQTTGQTPHQWLVAQRLERAQALLRDFALPLAEVAAACGFADQSHFTRVFTKHHGTPPGMWRRQVRAES